MKEEKKGSATLMPGGEGMLLRIYTFGPLTIEWEGQPLPFPSDRLCGRGVAPVLALLRLLIGQPRRFAHRDWLMEQFWPDLPRRRAEERLDDVASGLRTLLRPPGSQEKLLYYVYGGKNGDSGYRLEAYPRIWVDADAFCWYVEQAIRLERFGQESLSFWEQAYQLASRGTFLLEESYSDWAGQRRLTLEGHLRQCIHRLVQLLREIGAYEQAMLRARTYWQQHMTDENALLQQAREQQQPWEETVKDAVVAYLRFASQNRDLMQIVFAEQTRLQQVEWQVFLRFAWRTVQMVQYAQASLAGITPSPDVVPIPDASTVIYPFNLLAAMMVALLNRTAIWWLRRHPEEHDQEPPSLDEAGALTARFLIAGLTGVLTPEPQPTRKEPEYDH